MIFCVFFSTTYAAATPPTTPVWITPTDATPGDNAVLHAFIYNATASGASLTVTFSEGTTILATAPTVNVPANAGKEVAVTIIVPEGKVVITAEVAHAVTAKKEVPSLEGVVGTVTLGENTPQLSFPNTAVFKQWGQSFLSVFEVYRLKEVTYFAVLKAKAKAALPSIPSTTTGTLLNPSSSVALSSFHPLLYVTYAYAAAGNFFFVQKMVYYVVIILAILLILRFIFVQLL